MNKTQIRYLIYLEDLICYLEKAKLVTQQNIDRTIDCIDSTAHRGYQSLYRRHEVNLARTWQLRQQLINQQWK